MKKTTLSFVAVDEPNNYMQNNFSQENGTSKVNSKAGEGCYGSQSKIYPVNLSSSAFRWDSEHTERNRVKREKSRE